MFKAEFSQVLYRILNPKLPDSLSQFLEKPHICRGRLENEKLRFDCTGASGSRVGPSRKTHKSEEKRPANQDTHKTDLSMKSSSKRRPFLCENRTARSASWPSLPNPLYKKLTLSYRNSNHSGNAFRHPSMDPKGSFLVLPGVPGSSHGPPGCQSGALGMPNESFGHQK